MSWLNCTQRAKQLLSRDFFFFHCFLDTREIFLTELSEGKKILQSVKKTIKKNRDRLKSFFHEKYCSAMTYVVFCLLQKTKLLFGPARRDKKYLKAGYKVLFDLAMRDIITIYDFFTGTQWEATYFTGKITLSRTTEIK